MKAKALKYPDKTRPLMHNSIRDVPYLSQPPRPALNCRETQQQAGNEAQHSIISSKQAGLYQVLASHSKFYSCKFLRTDLNV